MAIRKNAVDSRPDGAGNTDELERALAELREVNEQLVTAGVRMQELADEARQARDDAEAANRAKDEFLAALSHELRTPLNAILGWTHMLMRTGMTRDAAAHALDIIERNATLQSRLIADLLQVSEIISGKLQLEVEGIDLASLLHASVDTFRPAATAKAIALEYQIDHDVRPVLGDPTRIQQIIWNVLSNALKFTPRGGTIAVTLTQHGSTAKISITDNGTGIEPAVLPHIFERFRQGDGSSHRAFGGLGLGLTIVRQLMELHGGTVRAESAGAGRGAAFTLRFPVPAVITAPNRIGRIDGASSLNGLQVLMVEDAADSRDLMMALLSGNGAEVTAVSTAREAVAEVNGHAPDVLIADIALPDRDGYQLIRQLRRSNGTRHFPAVALTAYAQPHDRERALAAGFDLHISKPVHPAEFVNAIALLAQRAREQGD